MINQNTTDATWSTASVNQNQMYIFKNGPIDIASDIETIWKIVKDVNRYAELSHGAVVAAIKGPMTTGTPITLRLYPDQLVGKFIPKVTGVINIVDEGTKTLSWKVHFPLGLGHSERFHELKSKDANKTSSYISDHIPGVVGFFTNISLKKVIENAFRDLNQGIKTEAELETREANRFKL